MKDIKKGSRGVKSRCKMSPGDLPNIACLLKYWSAIFKLLQKPFNNVKA